jgi:hypothetical protein
MSLPTKSRRTTPSRISPVVIPLGEIDTVLPLAEVYESVEFLPEPRRILWGRAQTARSSAR